MDVPARVRWLTVDEVSADWAERLDAGERARLEARRGPEERARLVGAAVLMRRVLAEAAGCAADDVGLDRTCADCGDPHGRPVPTGAARGWHVSASHSGPFVVVAVAERPVGVDVELVRAEPPSQPMLVRVLAEGEEAPTDAAGFARLWATKEAYLKALGTGLATPMREVRVGGGRVSLLSGAPRPGAVRPLRPPLESPAAAAAVCVLDG